MPQRELGHKTPENVELVFDDEHPGGASHHQKIVPSTIGSPFAGGIDLALQRWDEREHRPCDERRVDARGDRFGPFHDAQVAVDGEAAEALAELARWRWEQATGESVRAPEGAGGGEPVWPPWLEVDVEDIELGLSRTLPPHGGRDEGLWEVERLYER